MSLTGDFGPDATFAYDGMNRMTNMVDGVGMTKYTYSAAGQLLTEDGPIANDTVTNAYSNRLRTALSLQQPTGVWTNGFAYDSTKRLTNVTSPAGVFGYVYDPTLFTHHPSLLTLPNTSYITNAFDGNARLIATYLNKSDNSTFDSYTYVYNPANQRTSVARADSSTVAYTYDNIGQLTVADGSVSTEDRGYKYDSAWNLNWRTNNGTASQFSVNPLNELTGYSAFTNAYDANGNMTNAYGLRTMSYDDENRLVVVSDEVNHFYHTQFAYDGLGRLRERFESSWSTVKTPHWVITNTISYVYDGWRVIQERDGSNNPLVSYTRGNDLSGSMEGARGIGGLLARSSGYSSGDFTSHGYYFSDGNGNITYMLDSSQSCAGAYRYDAFGNTISTTSGTLASANVYRFSSKEIHTSSGMYYYGYRFYDPNLQRWISRDPVGEGGFEIARGGFASQLGDGPNLYSFVYNKPFDFVDSDGLAAVIAIGGASPILENPIGASLCAGAALGAGLCCLFPNTMTKPGELVGHLIKKPITMKPCTYTCVIQENGGRTRTIQRTVNVLPTQPCPAAISGPGVTCTLNK
jgi:RHS repeat-associated protein